VNARFFQPSQTTLVAVSEENWRTDPEISGGGLFHDMAPHHIDLLLWFFGDPLTIVGSSFRPDGASAADLVMGQLVFDNGIHCSGIWCFSVPPSEATDRCEIIGERGKIAFPFHGSFIEFTVDGHSRRIEFSHPQHIGQPMVERVTAYFSGMTDENPCPADEGIKVMEVIDRFTMQR
jgi:predicted dehydrogenase